MNKEEKTEQRTKSTRRRTPNHQYHKVLPPLFHTHKQPHQTDPNERSMTDIVRMGAASQVVVPSSSHVPPRPRSNNSLNPSTISVTSIDPSLRSAYSNDGEIHANPPSLIRSDRHQLYYFGTPTHSGAHQYHDQDTDASSFQFSYDPQSQLHPKQKHPSRTPLSYLKRSYFSSSFASSHRRKSEVSQSGGVDHIATTDPSSASSSMRRRAIRHRGSHILFLGQRLPDFETLVYCSGCEKWIQSRLRYRNGAMVWLASFVLLMCTVFLFWVPFYTKYFKDTVHYCPSCHSEIGRHSVL
ncbi:LITAF-like zinc ribbon domain-containing protein [Chlamydoabsidia padenii]|nr:LITAF-like zinc ribbon domain-containing protein [Chlamydoabsidia padenii]